MPKNKIMAACIAALGMLSLASVSHAQTSANAAEKAATPAASAEVAPEREAAAIDAVKAMGAYLRTLKTFGLQANTDTDEVLTTGQKLQFGGKLSYSVQAPNHLRAELSNDRKQRIYVYDGQTLTQFAPKMNYYATVDAPATIGETLEAVEKRFDISLPLSDLFLWGTEKAGIEDIQSAAHIGGASINGVLCDHYAYRQAGTDWQLWIQRGAKPLPLKIVITTTDEPAQPQYSAVLSWNLAPKFNASTFKFTPPKDAKRIPVVPVATAAAQ